jgi:uncharacterized membrane protein YGL010W
MIWTDRAERFFADYEDYHRDPRNEWCHYIGVPMILFGLLGILWPLGVWHADLSIYGLSDQYPIEGIWAVGLVLAASIFYLWMDFKRGALFGFVLQFALAPAATMTLKTAWILFVVGWIFQLMGHFVFEKRSPAFLSNLVQVFVAPIWIFARLTGRSKAT